MMKFIELFSYTMYFVVNNKATKFCLNRVYLLSDKDSSKLPGKDKDALISEVSVTSCDLFRVH